VIDAFAPKTYADWRRDLDEMERCPWAGPRPLRATEEAQLVGRTGDVRGFLSDVFSYSLVILEAESGVGKSSLIQAGLIPELRAHDYEPFYCDRWAVATPGASPEDHLTEVLGGQLGLEPGESLVDVVDERFGPQAVLILDQFEELIRYDEDFFRSVGKWILKVIEEHDVKVVLSLRSEYAHRLRRIERKAGPWAMVRRILEPVSDVKAVRTLLELPTHEGKVGLAPSGVDAVLKLWKKHKLDRTATGMLRLHALLYALHGCLEPEDAAIDKGHVRTFVAAAKAEERRLRAGRSTAPSAFGVFDAAMATTVRLKMALCESALGASGEADRYLCHGTRQVVEAIVQHLSSGGYKLVRERWNLAERALDREFRVLWGGQRHRADEGLARSAFEELTRLSDRAAKDHLVDKGATVRSPEELAAAQPEERPSPTDFLTATWDELLDLDTVREVASGSQPWEADPGDLSSGAMLAMAPDLVAVEELRRFTFALRWLEDTTLVRLTSAPNGRSMVSLVHDGFGAALEAWARASRAQPLDAIVRLTASKGDVFEWAALDDGRSPAEGAQIVNVRWRDGSITAPLRHVTFVNCDLRGMRFEGSTFEGVHFLNCVLDGVTFSNCTVIGTPSPFAEPAPKGVPPSFGVELGRDVVDVHARYRGARQVDEHPSALVSHTSGMPAVPLTAAHRAPFPSKRREGKPWLLDVPEPTGGLAMYGGRLCSLTVRRCTFVDGGTLALRLVSGTALDVVECTDGTVGLDILGSAIRGLTITGPVGEDATVAARVHIEDAAMAATWFGPGIEGSATIDDAIVWELLSLSDRARFPVALQNCAHFGAVNVGEPDGESVSIDPQFQIDRIDDPEAKAEVAGRMDFQSDPARAEFERRIRTRTLPWPAISRAPGTD
jgi:hypothetical protein